MDPKQTSPLGNNPAGGQEGQNGQPAGTQPVFGAAGGNGAASNSTMAGQLGAANLSTGANVSRTMDSLNSKNQSATGSSVFSKHKFDKVEPNGDIILPSSGPVKKEHKPINKGVLIKIAVIAGGILGVLVIILAVVLMPKGGGNKQGGGTIASNLDYQQAFNRYANYVLFGVDDSEQILTSSYDDKETYQLEYSFGRNEITEADEANYTKATTPITANSPQYQLINSGTFFDTAMSYYSDFLEKSVDIDFVSYPRVESLIYAQTDGINFLNAFASLNEPALPTILNKVAEAESIDDVNAYIDESYANLAESSSAGARYAEVSTKYLKAMAERYNYFKENNCVKDGTIDTKCTGQLKQIPEIPAENNYETTTAIKNNIISIATNDVLRGCFYLPEAWATPDPITYPTQDVEQENGANADENNDTTNTTDSDNAENTNNAVAPNTSKNSDDSTSNDTGNTENQPADNTSNSANGGSEQ
ncbi:hypothetical protein IJH16_02500 [Candidatus Saccharibacteria bacterium]|nr:hypothetical protein [Candidatus Saccharibacteria bacterium]